METLKKPTLLIVATAAAILLILWSQDAFGYRDPIFAFLVNWLAMSWVAVAGQVIHFSLPARYYEFKTFERSGRVYEHIGIRFFKRLVRRGPLAIFSPTLRLPKDRAVEGLRKLEQEMRKAETGHVYIFGMMLVFTGYALLRGWFDAAGWLTLFNVLINGYPVMLQRYNRILLQKLIAEEGG